MREPIAPAWRDAARRLLAQEDRARLAAEAKVLGSSLKRFILGAWEIIEPENEFIDGFHIDAICDHLEAAVAGEIPWLLISMPPGHMKSLLCSVAFPAWVWCERPEMRVLTASYASEIARGFSIQSRSIVESDWYQARWPTPLRHDQNRQDKYENHKRGFRIATSVGAKLTGLGGSVFVFDDPISMDDIYSDTKRATTNRWLDNVSSTRIRNMKPGARIMVAQRGHELDPIGHLLKKKIPGLVHLNLQARFVPHKRCVTRWFTDPRTKAGEPLWPGLYPDKRLTALEKYGLTPDAFAAQFQQEPVTEGGSILKRKWWRIWTDPKLPRCEAIILSIDPSMKGEQENAPWACTVWGAFQHHEPAMRLGVGRDMWSVILLGSWAEHLGYPEAKAKILRTVADWTIEKSPPNAVIIEDKAAGPVVIREMALAGIDGVTPWPPKGYQFPDKVARARLTSDMLYQGRVFVPGRKLADGSRSAVVLQSFAERVVAQAELFPAGEHDDLVDTATQAWWWLRDCGWAALDTDDDHTHDPQLDVDRRRESAYG